MKNNIIQDERILLERRKIQSKAYALIVYILLISIIVQQFILKAPFAQYGVEFFILIGCGVYNIISNYYKGIDIWNPTGKSKRKLLLDTLVTAAASVMLFAFLSGYKIKDLASYFVIFNILFFIFQLIMIGINNKKQHAIDKELNDDDTIE